MKSITNLNPSALKSNIVFGFVLTLVMVLILPEPVPAQTLFQGGDLNGSGEADITDVIFLAEYLFLGGPAPKPVVCPAPLPGGGPVQAEFENQYYKPLDLQRAAKNQWGPLAVLTSTGEHLYDWKVRVGKVDRGLDLEKAVADQYGAGYRQVTTGVHRYDWKAFRFSEPDYVVLPVLLISSDRFFDVAGVRQAIERYRSALANVQGFYDRRVEGDLRMLQPLAIPTALTSAQWNEISIKTQQEQFRYLLLQESIKAYEDQLPAPGSNLRIVLAAWTGDSIDIWWGAASTGRYAAATPRETSLDCPFTETLDFRCADAVYAIGHELGHTFDLGHTCDDFPGHPDCQKSIMQTGKPPEATLIQKEICKLLDSPFFHAY